MFVSPSALCRIGCRRRYPLLRRLFVAGIQHTRRTRNGHPMLRRDYCCDEHRKEEQRLSNLERQQRICDDRQAARLAAARKHK